MRECEDRFMADSYCHIRTSGIWLMSVGGCLIQSPYFERSDLNKRADYWLRPLPPSFQSNQLCSLWTRSSSPLSPPHRVRPLRGSCFHALITAFVQVLTDLCSVGHPPQKQHLHDDFGAFKGLGEEASPSYGPIHLSNSHMKLFG